MAQRQHDPDSDQQPCQEAVDLLLARHEWQLLTPVEFAQRTYAHVRAGITADPQRAAIYTYCEALHDACSGREGAARRERAYTELYRWLYDLARQRYADDAEELAQQALVRTFTAFEQCRQPGAFLAFALQHLRDAARSQRRRCGREAVSLDASDDEPTPHRAAPVPEVSLPDPYESATNGEVRLRIAQVMATFIRKHPRAAAQLDAVWLKYIEGLDDGAISERLSKPVKRVHELRSLGLKKLRGDPQWRALASDFGITPSDEE